MGHPRKYLTPVCNRWKCAGWLAFLSVPGFELTRGTRRGAPGGFWTASAVPCGACWAASSQILLWSFQSGAGARLQAPAGVVWAIERRARRRRTTPRQMASGGRWRTIAPFRVELPGSASTRATSRQKRRGSRAAHLPRRSAAGTLFSDAAQFLANSLAKTIRSGRIQRRRCRR